MNQQTKICQNCKQKFIIEPEDFDFYEKIKVPVPTFCPDCRIAQRMFWRNERALYKRKCDAPDHNEEFISIYAPDKSYAVFDSKEWWSDNWDPMDYGKEYDFTKSFFHQFKELLQKIPLVNLSAVRDVNCDYCNVSSDDKDCYLTFASIWNERVFYGNRVVYSRDSIDVYMANKNELCYETINCNECYRLFFSSRCVQCSYSSFLYNCVNCQDCFACTNLRNKQYYIFNKPYSKKEYIEKIKEFDISSFKVLQKVKSLYDSLLLESIHRFAIITKSVDVSGDNIQNAKNCKFCFDLVGTPFSAEDCKFLIWGGYGAKECHDLIGFGDKFELSYQCVDSGNIGARLLFTVTVQESYDVFYSINCHGSSNLFGCIGLRNKKYCILNKQYSKEEYERLVPKIIQHMNGMPYIDKKRRKYKYGEFFPPELSPFAYNETIAQEYFPLTKEQTIQQGHAWKDSKKKEHKTTLKPQNIPDHIKGIKDDILNKVIGCAHEGKCNEQCTTAFKIIPHEFKFYKKMNLPLPRLCPNCRHYQRLKKRSPLKLWHRKCHCGGAKSDNKVYKNTIKHFHGTKHCPNEFETTYAPDRKEIVYCEKCYQAEVV